MQLSAVLNIFIVKTKLNSIFANDLKRKCLFRKMFIVTALVSLREDPSEYKGLINTRNVRDGSMCC